jgi:II/X family phage/plasmid replication protein
VYNWAARGVTPDSIFDELFGRLTISEATMREPANLDAIPPRLRTVYQLWADGHDLRELFSRPTFYRHRKALLALGIDIAVKQPRDVSNVVPLVVTLVGREVGVPDWARGTPLYFDPPARAVA